MCSVFAGEAAPFLGGMKQRRAAAGADVVDRQKQRAGGLAMTIDPEQFSGLIVLADDGIETPIITAHLAAGGRAGRPAHPSRQGGGDCHGGSRALHRALGRVGLRRRMRPPSANVSEADRLVVAAVPVGPAGKA